MKTKRTNPESGSTMLASLCLSTVAAISLGSYVTITYNSLKESDAIVTAVSEELAAENVMEETLYTVQSIANDVIPDDWSVEDGTTTRTITGLNLATVASSLPVKFNEAIDLLPAPEVVQKVLSPFEALMQSYYSRFFRYREPEPEPEVVVETEVIDPTAVEVALSSPDADNVRTLTLTQKKQNDDGSILVRTLTATIEPLKPIQNAIIAGQNIRLRRAGVVDSYQSSLGTYAEQTPGYDAVLAAKNIVVNRAVISGYVSASGDRAPYFGRRAVLQGPDSDQREPIDGTRIVASPYQPNLDALSVSGVGSEFTNQSTVLGSSDSAEPRIYYAGNVDLSGDQQIVINGDTQLVVDGTFQLRDSARIVVQSGAKLELQVKGNVNLSGQGIVNESQVPANVAVIVTTPYESEVLISTRTPLHGVIYAPKANIRSVRDGSELFGAIVAQRVIFDEDTSFHFDTDLRKASFDGIETAYVFGSGK